MIRRGDNQTAHIAFDLCGDKPHIAGHRIRVQDIVAWHEYQGMSADEIVSNFPQITLADVYAALAYYFDHLEDVQKQMNDDEEYVESVRRQLRSTRRSIDEILAGYPGGRLFRSADDVDACLQEERNSWEH